MNRACAICACWLMLAGCDGVGRALVGNERDSDAAPGCMPLDCDLEPPTAPILDGEEPAGVASCALSGPEPPCDAAPPVEPLSNGVAAQCGQVYSLDDDELDGAVLQQLGCGRVVLERTQGGTLRLDDVRWAELDVSVQTTQPFVLELGRAELNDVRVMLVGPVVLRVLDHSTATRVAVASTQPSADFELIESAVTVLRAGSAQAPFEGSIDLQRAEISDAAFHASELSAESSTFKDVVVAVGQLQLTDSTGYWLELGFDAGLLSACHFRDLSVARCERLSVYDSELRGAAIVACAGEPTRLYTTSLLRSSIEGAVVGDHARLDRVRVGAADVSSLQLWESVLSGVALCAGTQQVTLGIHNRASCVTCKDDDGSWVPLSACRSTEVEPVFGTACGALFAPQVCEEEPQRMRPSN